MVEERLGASDDLRRGSSWISMVIGMERNWSNGLVFFAGGTTCGNDPQLWFLSPLLVLHRKRNERRVITGCGQSGGLRSRGKERVVAGAYPGWLGAVLANNLRFWRFFRSAEIASPDDLALGCRTSAGWCRTSCTIAAESVYGRCDCGVWGCRVGSVIRR